MLNKLPEVTELLKIQRFKFKIIQDPKADFIDSKTLSLLFSLFRPKKEGMNERVITHATWQDHVLGLQPGGRGNWE